MTDWRAEFATPKFIVALMAVGVFVWAFGHDPGDATMKGAIIGGFNLALGFYLGSTNSASVATDNTGKAFDAITAAANSTPAIDTPQPVVVMQPADQPVPVADKSEGTP
jgi:hypothetical protein